VVEVGAPDDRVIPHPSPLTAGYWEAAQRRQLALLQCRSCRRFVHFPEPVCPWCGGQDLRYERVSGAGVVHTFTVVSRTFAPGFATRTPYVLAWIDLPEQVGLRAFGNVLGAPVADVAIGTAVRVCFEERPGFGLVPNFEVTTA
jgi:uncharacterized protein